MVSIENTAAILDLQPDPSVVRTMVNSGVTTFTDKTNASDAWRSLVSTQDVVGIKVFSEPGMLSGTRPAVVAAVIEGLLAAGVPPQHIIIWDKHAYDLRDAGFSNWPRVWVCAWLAAPKPDMTRRIFTSPTRLSLAASSGVTWNSARPATGVGRKSFLTKIVSQQITKIISIAPLLNQEDIGVCGHLYSLALGSVDNIRRFEANPGRLAIAVPEIYALPMLGDRVVLNITDALLGQYEGGGRALLHYSAVPNQLWFSRDPVALDVLAIQELANERRAAGAPQLKPTLELYANANLLQLGENSLQKIQVQKSARLPLPKRNPIEFLVAQENSPNYENLVDMSTCL